VRRYLGLVLVLAVGCNALYDLEPTTLRDPNNPFDAADYDLDGHGNSVDNCPAIANADQTDGDDDDVGDVCDLHPGVGTDRIVERTFFADPAFDRDRWHVSNFAFEARAVVSDVAATGAMLRSKRSYEDRFVAVELGFEMIVWNPHPFYGGINIILDDVGGPQAELRHESDALMVLSAGPTNEPSDSTNGYIEPAVGVDIPIKLTLAYDRDSTRLVARLGAVESGLDVPSTLPPGPMAISLVESAARIRYLVIYGRR